MPPFDPARSHGIIIGQGAVRFEQDGRYYNGNHDETDALGNPVAPPPVGNDDVVDAGVGDPGGLIGAPRDAPPVPPPAVEATAPVPPPPSVAPAKSLAPPADLSAVDWRQLRKWMVAAGQTYTNKDEAVEYLTAHPDAVGGA